jgi:hypothetical protein
LLKVPSGFEEVVGVVIVFVGGGKKRDEGGKEGKLREEGRQDDSAKSCGSGWRGLTSSGAVRKRHRSLRVVTSRALQVEKRMGRKGSFVFCRRRIHL